MRLPATHAIALEPSTATPHARVEKAAHELEAQFAQMLIKSMRSASFGNPLMGENSTYRDMYDQQLARELTKGRGLGLAPIIMRQLEGRTAAPPATDGMAPASYALPSPTASLPLLPSMSGGPLPLAPSTSGVSMPALPAIEAAVAPAADAAACPPDAPLDCSSPEAFVRSIWPHAQKTAAELGVPAKALVAQAALETGWGRRLAGNEGGASSQNLFGIKAGSRWSGQRMSASTHEFVDGVRRTERADFRAYASPADSFADYARVIGNPRYAAARGAGDDVHGFASALQQAGYATDPSYAAKITAIADGATLNRALATLPGAGANALNSYATATSSTTGTPSGGKG